MILMDVTILVYAHREDTPEHPAYRDWVEDTINNGGAYGVSELVLSGFLRVVTHPKVFVGYNTEKEVWCIADRPCQNRISRERIGSYGSRDIGAHSARDQDLGT